MQYDELIRLFFERSNALQWYWTLYVLVIGGLLMISALRVRRDVFTCILITVLFSFFAYKNLGAIHDVTVQRLAISQAIDQYVPVPSDGAEVEQIRKRLEPTLVTPAYAGVRNFHILCDVLTIAVFWTMELRRIRNARIDSAK